MKPKFQIIKVHHHYIIKKRVYLLPFFYSREMDTQDFEPYINDYKFSFAESEIAKFKTINQCFDAISQWASINGCEEVVVKVVDRL